MRFDETIRAYRLIIGQCRAESKVVGPKALKVRIDKHIQKI